MVLNSPTVEDTKVRERMAAIINIQSSPDDPRDVFERVCMEIYKEFHQAWGGDRDAKHHT